MLFRPLAYKDCIILDEMEIARVIADKLLKKKTQGQGHGGEEGLVCGYPQRSLRSSSPAQTSRLPSQAMARGSSTWPRPLNHTPPTSAS